MLIRDFHDIIISLLDPVESGIRLVPQNDTVQIFSVVPQVLQLAVFRFLLRMPTKEYVQIFKEN